MLTGNKILLYLALKYSGDWDKIYQAIKNKENLREAEVEERIADIKSGYVTIIDEDYPNSLKNSYKPPFVLFYYGDIKLITNSRKRLSVIGSRDHGKDDALIVRKLFDDLNSYEMVVISGMARGIDTIAHEEAIAHGFKTIAVLASGIDYCYPKRNLGLYEKMKNDHLILSEYPLDVAPSEEKFPFRNRIVVSLSDGLLVINAKNHSGSLTSVGHALHAGKEVMCVPHSIFENSYCNSLIKDGATLIENGNDIAYQIGLEKH